MASKKPQGKSKTKATSKATKGASGVVPPPPATGAPSPPSAFQALSRSDAGHLLKLTDAQFQSANAVGDEVTASDTYAEDLGPDAPDAASLADKLALASAWDHEATNAEAWAHYAETQKLRAADDAARAAKLLQAELAHATKNHPEVAARYPLTSAFVGARKAAAARGTATKAKKKKAAKKAAAAPKTP